MSPADDTPGIPFPPPLIPLAGLLAGFLLDWVAPLRLGFTSGLFGLALGLGGLALVGMALAELRQDAHPFHAASALRTGGVLRFTRNPIYLGFVLLVAGAALASGNAWLWLAVPLVWLGLDRVVVVREERYLAARFPAEYIAYCARVRRWL